MSVHKGPCQECGKPMLTQQEWNRNPAMRQGRVKYGGYGRCGTCYVRGRRHGTLPSITITTRYPVNCDQCGRIAEPIRWDEAKRARAEHLQQAHGIGPSTPKLSEAELTRLRRMVGVA